MEYSETLEQATEYALSAFSLMKGKGIPVNPNNFTVWYHHYSGNYPDLKRTLDVLLDNDQEFTEVRNLEIFEKYFTFDQEDAVLNDAAHKIEEAISHMLVYLDEHGENTAEYGKTLETVSKRVGASQGGTGFKKIISKVLTATREMELQNKTLERRVHASSSEVKQLRGDLEDMRREAMTDGLTGIANRKLFDIELRRFALDAMESGENLCLLMIDIDFFKKFNDTYGHQVGDQVLKLLAATLVDCIKGQDVAARYGGEEFSVILPGTALKDALKVAETIRMRVSGKKVVNRKTDETLGKITISVGVGRFELGEPLTQFIHRADEALYMAKRNGRDKVVSQDRVEISKLAFGT